MTEDEGHLSVKGDDLLPTFGELSMGCLLFSVRGACLGTHRPTFHLPTLLYLHVNSILHCIASHRIAWQWSVNGDHILQSLHTSVIIIIIIIIIIIDWSHTCSVIVGLVGSSID